MRGEDEFRPLGSGNPVRNTPTCVGKTWTATTNASGAKKHPHVRGEDTVQIYNDVLALETPPRAWGRRLVTGIWSISSRNTPTCVGKTQDSQAKNTRMWKHPHVRGEDMDWRFACFCPLETPPRAWGRRNDAPGLQAAPGNTPTCVGKTLTHFTASIYR